MCEVDCFTHRTDHDLSETKNQEDPRIRRSKDTKYVTAWSGKAERNFCTARRARRPATVRSKHGEGGPNDPDHDPDQYDDELFLERS